MPVNRYTVLPAAVLIVVLLIGAIGCDPVNPQQPQQRIPLSSIISTSGEEGLATARDGFRDGKPVEEFGNELQRVLDTFHFNGASNVFLVDAPTIGEAMSATAGVFSGRAADVPAVLNRPDPPRGSYWMVVYLGVAGSSPTHWLIDSVSVETGRIRFNYHRSASGAETKDMHQYYYWVPLGKLEYDVYKLELYDESLEDVTLSRRVEIKPPRATKRVGKTTR